MAPHRAHDDVEAVQRHTLRRDGDTSKTSVISVCVCGLENVLTVTFKHGDLTDLTNENGDLTDIRCGLIVDNLIYPW